MGGCEAGGYREQTRAGADGHVGVEADREIRFGCESLRPAQPELSQYNADVSPGDSGGDREADEPDDPGAALERDRRTAEHDR